jgi:putative transcriptional regulator
MSYAPIQINRENLTILGVVFPDLATLDSAANAIGSNMFEGFVPTTKGIMIIRDYLIGNITLKQFMKMAREKAYAYVDLILGV